MCGIAGVFRLSGRPGADDVAAVCAMLRAQAHRGPDDWGLVLPASLAAERGGDWLDAVDRAPGGAPGGPQMRTYPDRGGPGAVLGARRLAILDRSTRGRMPMGTGDGRLWLAHNGEVYNHVELRQALRATAPFHSGADTEAILHGYDAWGEDVLRRLRGMFAFALFEAWPRPRLFLARDRLGIKPLYYRADGERLLFASEVRALARSGRVPDDEDEAAVVRFLQLGSVPAARTTVRGVMALLPGHRLTVDPGGHPAPRRYWDLSAFAGDPARPAPGRDAAAAEVRALLEESVRLHLASDAPLGVFLSGGIDSSSLAAMASRGGDRTLTTLFVGSDDVEPREARAARLVARRYGTDHREIALCADQVFNALPEFFRAMDQPTVDGLNTYVIASAARRAGVTVALSGAGGDEVFWGYAHLRRAAALERAGRSLAALPRPARRALASAVRWAGAGLGHPGLDRLSYFDARSPAIYLAVRGLFAPEQVATLLGIGLSELEAFGPPLDAPAKAAAGQAIAQGEFGHYLPNQLLRDADVMGMAHSVEIRVPFLDHPLVEHVAALPTDVKVARREPKPLLLRAMRDALPREVWDRPKVGFTLPLSTWLARRAPELRAQSLEGGRLDARAVGAVWDAFEAGRCHWSRPWALVVLSRVQAERAKRSPA